RFTPIKVNPHITAKRNGGSTDSSTKRTSPLNESPKTLAQVRKEMEQNITKFITGDYEGKVLYLQVPAGAGKSYATTNVINKLFPSGQNILWFGSMHDQFSDLDNLRDNNWVHIRGRSKGHGYVPQNCKLVDEARELYNRRLSVPENLCKEKCRYLGKCPYWKQLKEKGHKFMPHQMLFFFDGRNAPLVVFDELDLKVFLDLYKLDANELLRLMKQGHKKRRIRQFWQVYHELLVKGKGLSGRELYNALKRSFKVTSLRDLRKEIASLDFNTTETSNDDAKSAPIFGIGQIMKDIMLSEIDSILKRGGFNPRIHVNPSHTTYKKRTLDHIEVRVRRDPPEWLKDKPIILLGAKGDPHMFVKIFGKAKNDFYLYSPKIELPKQVEVIKETKQLLPQPTLNSPKNRILVYREVSECLDEKLDTCLICHNDHEDSLSELFPVEKTIYDNGKVSEYKDTSHYYAVRGLNQWKDYHQIVVIGTPTPNLDDMMRQIETIYWDEGPLDKSVIKNGFYDYQDKRISHYLHSLREDEIYQSVFRIRPLDLNGRGKIKIIIASALPLEDIDPYITKRIEIPTTRVDAVDKKYEALKTAADSLLSAYGYFTNEELLREGSLLSNKINADFVKRNRRRLIKDFNLRRVPNKYPHVYEKNP
ncbi:MAG: hypothetical protein GY861_00720, partial [bacterium]|nr:hypothetical protein [bacterium]